jgi:lipoprotein NlpD
MLRFILFSAAIFLVACTESTTYAPVVDVANIEPMIRRVAATHPKPNFPTKHWIWPATGKVLNAFSATNKGINITGRAGEPIVAVAAGQVVYAGSGLRGYGNLIIIKHNSIYLSAYAHNKSVYVKEGDWVKQGQRIAQMGNQLHFEIRKNGKPVNPLMLLMPQ